MTIQMTYDSMYASIIASAKKTGIWQGMTAAQRAEYCGNISVQVQNYLNGINANIPAPAPAPKTRQIPKTRQLPKTPGTGMVTAYNPATGKWESCLPERAKFLKKAQDVLKRREWIRNGGNVLPAVITPEPNPTPTPKVKPNIWKKGLGLLKKMPKAGWIGLVAAAAVVATGVGIWAATKDNEKVENKSEVKPETPVVTQPETPVTTQPETPVVTQPETPVVTQPETPVTTQPETQVTDVPEAPVTTQPEEPAKSEDKTGDKAGDKPVVKAEDKTENKKEDKSAVKAEDKTGDKANKERLENEKGMNIPEIQGAIRQNREENRGYRKEIRDNNRYDSRIPEDGHLTNEELRGKIKENREENKELRADRKELRQAERQIELTERKAQREINKLERQERRAEKKGLEFDAETQIQKVQRRAERQINEIKQEVGGNVNGSNLALSA